MHLPVRSFILLALIAPAFVPLAARAAINRNPKTPAEKLAYEFLRKAARVDRNGFEKKLYCSDRKQNLTMVALYFRHETDMRPQYALVHQHSARWGSTEAPIVIDLAHSGNITTRKQGYASRWDSNLSVAFRHEPSSVNMRFELFREPDNQGRVGMWVSRAHDRVGASVGCFPKAKQAAEWLVTKPLVQTMSIRQILRMSQNETL
jgi:hypothetical protein